MWQESQVERDSRSRSELIRQLHLDALAFGNVQHQWLRHERARGDERGACLGDKGDFASILRVG